MLCRPAGAADAVLRAKQNRDSGPGPDPPQRLLLGPAAGPGPAGEGDEEAAGVVPLAAAGRGAAQRRAAAAAGGGGSGVPGVVHRGPGGPLHPGPEEAAPGAAGG